MPLTGQPTFEARDVPTVTQMNAWMTTISNKFGSGSSDNTSVVTADIEWPLQAGGHIDMDGNEFDKIPRLGAIYSLADRRPWQTTRMIFEEVEARGGGTVLLPGNTTIVASTDKDALTGIRVGSNTWFRGHGHSSVSGQLYMDGKEKVRIRDMQLGGTSVLKNCHDVIFRNIDFTATSGDYQIWLKNCTNVRFVNCQFVGAATSHVRIEDCEDIWVKRCWFEDFADVAIRIFVPEFHGGSEIHIIGNTFYHPAASASTNKVVIWITVTSLMTNSSAWTAGQNAILMGANDNFSIRGNIFFAKSGGIQLDNGRHIKVSCNYFGDLTIATRMFYRKTTIATYPDFFMGWREGPMLTSNIVALASDTGFQLQAATHAVLRGNVVHSADEALILEQADIFSTLASDAYQAGSYDMILGNVFFTDDGTLPAAAVWNLKLTPTRLLVKMLWSGNHMDGGTSNRGYRSFTDAGSTAGGEIGDTTTSGHRVWWLFEANNSQGTTITGGANEDMKDGGASGGAEQSIVQNNNT